MEKKVWVRPEMNTVTFAADEYVAACWKINCNVPGPGWNGTAYLYNESNGQSDLQTDNQTGDELLLQGDLNGCQEWHKGIIRDDAPKANGYWVTEDWEGKKQVYSVFWWIEDLGSKYDYHATLMNKIEWATNPNAS